MRQKQQKGSVTIHRGSWVLRWREYSEDAQGQRKVKRCFKVLGEVTKEHRQNLKRAREKMRESAQDTLAPINNHTATTVSVTIGELVKEYFKDRPLKPSTLMAYRVMWNRYLENRIGHLAISSFKRVDAYALWKQIHDANPHLGRATLTKIRFLISGVFEHAKNTGRFFGENPATADLPAGLRPPSRNKETYTAEEVGRLISLFPSPRTQAILALAFLSGVRKGELAALKWEDWELQEPRTEQGKTKLVKLDDYDSRQTDKVTGVLHVCRSVWNGRITTPKTEASADDCHIDSIGVAYVEAYRQSLKSEKAGEAAQVNEGFMWGGKKPIDLRSFARWQIEYVLNRCAKCGDQPKVYDKKAKKWVATHTEHSGHDHEYEKNETLPLWRDWKPFRKGNATYLSKNVNGDGDRAASLSLRHTNPSVTINHYIDQSKQELRAKAARKELAIAEQRQVNAAVLGAGLRQAMVN